MKKRYIGSPGWSLFFLLLIPLIGIAVALILHFLKLLKDWIR
jgi:hypothetical protein